MQHRGNGQDFVSLDSGDESSDGLPDNDEDTFDRIGVFGGERSCNAGVSEFDLVVHEAGSSFLGSFSHALLGQLVHHLHFFGDAHSDIVLNLGNPSLEGLLFLLLVFFFLHDVTDVSSANNCHPYICVSESSHIIGSIASVYDSSLLFFEVFYDNFLVVGGGSCENVDKRIVVMRNVFAGRGRDDDLWMVLGFVFEVFQAVDFYFSAVLMFESD